jgi:SAM-dependent methyltransferase
MKLFGFYIGNRSQNNIILVITILLTALLIILCFFKKPIRNHEGFTQNEKFLVRRQQDIYDDFTAQIFDKIFLPKITNHYIFDTVEKLTLTDFTKSVLLDAGSGTGELVAYIQQKGYTQVFGMDQSNDMNQIALSKYPNLKLKQGDLDQPMSFDKNTFTHIFMTGSTIYNFQDKVQLFSNLFYWLIPNGYLILQVADREKFDPIPPIGKPVLVDSVQVFVEDRVTDTEIDFIDFKYKSSYDFTKTSDNIVIFQETFTDSYSRNVRMNEQILFMESLDNIIYMAQSAGFIVHGQVNLKEANQDKYQYVFILERPH